MNSEKTFSKKNIIICAVIFASLFLALFPVILSNNYLRQDDLMWEIWPGMKMSDFGFLYYNTVFQLVRPLCMLSFYLTDLLSINMHLSVYVRLMSIMAIGSAGIMLYFWQLRFNPNKLLAATFAISTFTLPGYQLFAATANYFLILCALLLTLASAFCWHKSFTEQADRIRKRYFRIGCALFFLSLLEYPLSSMFVWALFVICYLNSLSFSNTSRFDYKRFAFSYAVITIALMVLYFIFMNVFHWVFHVDLHNSRSGVIESGQLVSRVLGIFNIIAWHAHFWRWNDIASWSTSPAPFILALFAFAVIQINLANGVNTLAQIVKNIVKAFTVCFVAFFIAYSPVFAISEFSVTFRYTLVTMPILLYMTYWSLTQIAYSSQLAKLKLASLSKIACTLALMLTTMSGICYANWMIADGIVGPHEHDFAYIQKELQNKVIPLLNQNKQVVIHAIDCNNNKSYDYHFEKGLPTAFEYGMRICTYQQQVIGVIFHSMMVMGHLPNYRKHNTVIYKDNEIAVKDTPWGTLVVNSGNNINDELKQYAESKRVIVEIDTRNIPPYQPFEFYKNVLKSLS